MINAHRRTGSPATIGRLRHRPADAYVEAARKTAFSYQIAGSFRDDYVRCNIEPIRLMDADGFHAVCDSIMPA